MPAHLQRTIAQPSVSTERWMQRAAGATVRVSLGRPQRHTVQPSTLGGLERRAEPFPIDGLAEVGSERAAHRGVEHLAHVGLEAAARARIVPARALHVNARLFVSAMDSHHLGHNDVSTLRLIALYLPPLLERLHMTGACM